MPIIKYIYPVPNQEETYESKILADTETLKSYRLEVYVVSSLTLTVVNRTWP